MDFSNKIMIIMNDLKKQQKFSISPHSFNIEKVIQHFTVKDLKLTIKFIRK